MRRFTRLALAALAAIGTSGALVAAPAASWTNFADTTSEGTVEGVRQYTLPSGDYRITINGTPNADGSVTLGTSKATTNNTGIVLTRLGALSGTKIVSVMLDVGNLPEATAELLAINLNAAGAEVELKRVVAEDGTSTIQQQWNNQNGSTDEPTKWGKAAWTPANRQILTVTYSGDPDPQGTATYLNGSTLIANVGGLKTTGGSNTISRIGIGENTAQPATGLTVYGIYLFTTKLRAEQVASETAAVANANSVPLSFAFSRASQTVDSNVMEVTYTSGGVRQTFEFEATLTTATRVTEGSETDWSEPDWSEPDSNKFFKKATATSPSSLLTTNGYPMIACKFITQEDTSHYSDEGWSVYLPFTPSVAATVTRVCPKLFAVTSDGAVQGTPRRVFGYTVTLYSGSVDATTESPTALATATGTTDSLSGTTVNTKAADFTDKVTLNADTTYTMKLAVSASETGGGSYSGIGGVVFSNVASRTVSGKTGNWSTADEWDNRLVPTIVTPTTLNVSDAASLSMDAAASLSSLTVKDGSADGSASLTFTGTNSLTSITTTLNANTNVSAITANLGAVTLASGKTLTVGNATTLSGLAGEATSQVVYDLNASLADDATRRNLIQTFPGIVTFKATGANGATLAYAANSSVSLASCLAFDGGTHTFKYGRSMNPGNGLFATGRGDDLPTIDVKKDTTLDFYEKDLSGWTGTVQAKPAVIRVRNGGKLKFQDYGGSGFFRDRLVLDGGASVTMEGSNFVLHGGTQDADHAQIAMLDSTTAIEATLAGQIGITNINGEQANQKTSTIAVGNNATLKASAKFVGTADGGRLTKVGAGTLVLSSTETNTSNALTISAGKVLIENGSSWGTGAITVAESAALEVEVSSADTTKIFANTLSGAGTVKKLGAGTLSLTGAVSTPVEVVAGTLKLGASVTSSSVTVSGGVLEMGLPSSARTVTANGGAGKLVLRLTENEAAAESLPTQLSWTGDVSQVEVRNSDGALLARTVSKVDESNRLVLTVREASTWTWRTGALSWASGLPDFALGDSVTFGSNEASETVVVPSKTTMGAMSVAGKYAFTVAPGGLTASQITVSGTAKFNRLTVKHVRLTASNTNESGNAPALAELLLTKGGKVVLWPRGTTISQLNSDGTTTPPNWTAGGNEAVNALIDGVWSGQAIYTNPDTDGGTGRYGDSEPGNNKWWPRADPAAYAVIQLGAAIDFDGYQLRTADRDARSPRDWSLEVSADGTTWFVADRRANRTIPSTHSLYVYEESNTVFPLPATIAAPITVSASGTLGGDACVAGNVTFEAGATLDATGATPLEVTGTVTATSLTVLLPEGVLTHPVLKTATTGLESALSAEGYSFLYREGAYWAVQTTGVTLTAEVIASSNLTDLTWKDGSDTVLSADVVQERFALPGVTATLSTTTASTVTVDCTTPPLTLAGSAPVTLAVADDASIASLTIAEGYSGTLGTLGTVTDGALSFATPIKVSTNATLTVSNTRAMTLTGVLSGSGAIVFGGTGVVNVTAANGDYNGQITINSGATLTNEDHGEPIPFGKGSIVNNGTLKLIAGTRFADYGCALLPLTSGSGNIVFCAGSETRLPAPITTKGTITFEGTAENGRAAAKVTFVKSGDFTEKKASINGANVVVGAGVTLDQGTGNAAPTSPSITIAVGKSLSGSGIINVPVTFKEGSVLNSDATFTGNASFEAGATIKAVMGRLMFSAKVSLPETGVVKVNPNSYVTILTANLGGLRASAFAFDESVAETYAAYCLGTPLYTSEAKTQFLMLLTKPTVAAGTSDEVVSAITRAVADDHGFSNWQLSSAEAIGNATLDGAALFGHVTALDEQDSKVAKVSYNFGVDWLTVTAENKVVIRAKVASEAVTGVPATILSSTMVKVQQLTGTDSEGNPVWADVTSTELTSTEIEALGQTADGATRYLSIDRPTGVDTFSYRVVATDSAASN